MTDQELWKALTAGNPTWPEVAMRIAVIAGVLVFLWIMARKWD